MKQKTTSEILDKINNRVEHLSKLDKIRAERAELNASSIASKMNKEEQR